MKLLLLAALMVIGLAFVTTTCVDYANAKEPTTLEDALERPYKIQKYVDKENSVVCYWQLRHPQLLSCIHIPLSFMNNHRAR
jgi:hypothetical protein